MKVIFLIVLLLANSLFAGTINFKRGWNFVGLGSAINFSTDATFSDTTKVKLVWKYVNDPKQPTKGWQVYSADTAIQKIVDTNGLYSFNTLLPYEGAWVYAYKAFSYTTIDAGGFNNEIPVYTGWNLLSAVDNSNLSMNDNIFKKSLQTWVYRDSGWYLKINGATTPSLYGNLTAIHPYEAFWIYANSDVTPSNGSTSSYGNDSSTGANSSESTQSGNENSSQGGENTNSSQGTEGTNNNGGTENQGNEGTNNNEGNEGTGSQSSGSNTTGGTTGSATGTSTTTYTLLAWNDLGMHCMDGKDFSVFSILPPYNNLNAQLIRKSGTTNKHVISGVTITYTAAVSLNGKYNTTSMLDNNNNQKTNFWDYVGKLFNTTLANNTGLTGNTAPSSVAKPLKYNMANNWWEATGLPLTPYNDDGTKNYYPMVNVTAKDSSGKILATTKVVLPISDEMDCKACHSSTSNYALAKPSSGWENDANAEKDFKYNILKLHDQKFPTAVSAHQTALKKMGYTTYNNAGLYQSAKDGTPTLCATCHASNALPGTGIAGIKSLTEALHSLHANVLDPVANVKLGDSTNRNACYRCHPGATTKCLRGAMGKAVDANGNALIQCQSCHGSMQAVGKHARDGWLDEPNCQSCHQNGQRYTKAVTNAMTGTLRSAVDTRFATNVNAPMSGKSLYRFSTGHGNMQCSACHGSTHAIYPSSHREDNLQSIAVQGHKGTIAECTACHTTTPNTITGGPHGMHTVGQGWINSHKNAARSNLASCTACHGSNYRGTVLSKTFSARSFATKYGSKTYQAGQQVTCYDCHNGPSGK